MHDSSARSNQPSFTLIIWLVGVIGVLLRDDLSLRVRNSVNGGHTTKLFNNTSDKYSISYHCSI